ncbi:UNVERIFIED_CONTAM: hypothetical protein K2H54_045593 [Gekko kuhli]
MHIVSVWPHRTPVSCIQGTAPIVVLQKDQKMGLGPALPEALPQPAAPARQALDQLPAVAPMTLARPPVPVLANALASLGAVEVLPQPPALTRGMLPQLAPAQMLWASLRLLRQPAQRPWRCCHWPEHQHTCAEHEKVG